MTHEHPPATAGPSTYRITVEGHLGPRWSARFEGMTVSPEPGGRTAIHGPVTDQAALHSVLRMVSDLGLELISVARIEPTTSPSISERNPS